MKNRLPPIIIRQVFSEISMTNGFDGLSRIVAESRQKKVENLNDREVYLFLNRANNYLKVVARDSWICKKLTGNQTFDWKLRRHEIFDVIFKCLGLYVKCTPRAYKKIQKYRVDSKRSA